MYDMKVILAVFVSILVLSACNSTKNENKVIRKVTVKSYVAPIVNPDRMLTIEIEGMMCEMGCGASIRKELKATTAVSSVEYDFEEDRKVNVAKIAFNKDKISVDKIISILSTMNDKQFKVGKSSSENYTEDKVNDTIVSEIEHESNTSTENFISVQNNKFETTNFFSLFTRFFL